MARIYAPIAGGSVISTEGHAIGIPNIINVPFDYLTYDEYPLGQIEEDEVISVCGIKITQAFNDAAASLSIGDSSHHQRLMPTTMVNPAMTRYFYVSPMYEYTSATYVRLYINRAGATQGEGMIYLFVEY